MTTRPDRSGALNIAEVGQMDELLFAPAKTRFREHGHGFGVVSQSANVRALSSQAGVQILDGLGVTNQESLSLVGRFSQSLGRERVHAVDQLRLRCDQQDFEFGAQLLHKAGLDFRFDRSSKRVLDSSAQRFHVGGWNREPSETITQPNCKSGGHSPFQNRLKKLNGERPFRQLPGIQALLHALPLIDALLAGGAGFEVLR